jgi:hypothetical protein
VNDLDGFPVSGEVFGHEATVTVIRGLLATEETALMEDVFRESLLYFPKSDEFQEIALVGRPVAILAEGIEELLCWSEFGPVEVIGAADGFEKKAKIIPLGKPGELRNIIQADIDDTLNACPGEYREKLLR